MLDALKVVEMLLDAIVAAVGPEKAREYLSSRAVLLANEAADIIERERWPG